MLRRFQRGAGPDAVVSEAVVAGSARGPSAGMVLVPGGEFLMGTNDRAGFPADGEGPVRKVRVDPFYMDECAVTNAQFAEFVKSTGYKTEAERYRCLSSSTASFRPGSPGGRASRRQRSLVVARRGRFVETA